MSLFSLYSPLPLLPIYAVSAGIHAPSSPDPPMASSKVSPAQSLLETFSLPARSTRVSLVPPLVSSDVRKLKKKSRIRTYQAFHRPGVRIVQPQIFQICPELKNKLPSKLWFCMSFWHEAQRSHGTVKSTGCSESSQRLVYAVLQRHEVLLNPTDHLKQTHRPALNGLIMPLIMVYPKLWYTIKICQNIPKLRLL